MDVSDSIQLVASSLLAPHSLALNSFRTIQALWAGYGHICRLTASPIIARLANAPEPATCQAFEASVPPHSPASQHVLDASSTLDTQSYIMKLISPPLATNVVDESHARKMLSYQVEQYFYTQLAPQMPADIAVATCFASIKSSPNSPQSSETGKRAVTAMLLTDLRVSFPVPGERRGELNATQALAALDWLAGFHGFWWTRVGKLDRKDLVRPPLEEIEKGKLGAESVRGVWLNGGYSYLATRRAEYESLASEKGSEWSVALCRSTANGGTSVAEKVARVLAPRPDGMGALAEYETMIHGDVKSENLFTTVSGDQVAFYDFQYVGLGLGVSDLTKFFTCAVPLSMLVGDKVITERLEMQSGEKKLLEAYRKRVEKTSGKSYPQELLYRHWETALVDWLRFQASWGFWGNTKWLEARVRYILHDAAWNSCSGTARR